jgi:hypothetical protein
MAQKIEARTERPLQHFWLKRFLAVDTTDSRLALMDNACFYDLLNAQPVGFSNLHSVQDASAVLNDFGSHLVYRTWNVHLNPSKTPDDGTEYLICWATDNTLWAYDVDQKTTTQIGTVAGGVNGIVQFDWQSALIIGDQGYWYWNGSGQIQPILTGTNVTLPDGTPATGAAVPSGGAAIAVYQGMVWIAQGRMLYFSVPNNFVNFDTTAGGGWSALTDSTLKSDVTALFAANGYLYLFGTTSVDAISDVYYPVNPATGAQLATPSFTKLNLNAIVGTDQPESIIAYQRLVLFANRMGIWMIYGSTIERISGFDPNNNYLSSIDGTWQYLYFDQGFGPQPSLLTQQVSAGQVMSNALLCAAFLVYRKADPIFGTGPVIMMYQADMAGGKWWSADVADVGPLTYICTALVNKQPALFGFANNKLYQLFADPTSAPGARIMTGLWDFDDPLTDKQAIRAGVRMMLGGNPDRVGVKVMMDTTRDSYPISLSQIGLPEWTNQPSQITEWQTPGGTEVDWNMPNPPFLMYWGRAPQCWSPYIGFTMTTQPGTLFELNSMSLDYKLAARWSNT